MLFLLLLFIQLGGFLYIYPLDFCVLALMRVKIYVWKYLPWESLRDSAGSCSFLSLSPPTDRKNNCELWGMCWVELLFDNTRLDMWKWPTEIAEGGHGGCWDLMEERRIHFHFHLDLQCQKPHWGSGHLEEQRRDVEVDHKIKILVQRYLVMNWDNLEKGLYLFNYHKKLVNFRHTEY